MQEITKMNMCDVYALMAKNDFPKCILQGCGGMPSPFWIESQVIEWMNK